ncbi:MAG: hypothetical protein U0521_22700 [Anaerolineae bacterium]
MQDSTLDPHRDSLALIILSDEIREEHSGGSSSPFRQQDIALKVISGDNLETVREIAQEAGMDISGAYAATSSKPCPTTEWSPPPARGAMPLVSSRRPSAEADRRAQAAQALRWRWSGTASTTFRRSRKRISLSP